MISLTVEAEQELEAYLHRVRTSLASAPKIDGAEIEAEIRGHVETELAGEDQPVGLTTLRSVLDRLGDPTSWVPEEEISAWRRAIARFSGSDDWRLAYLCLLITGLGFLSIPYFLVGGVVLVSAGYLLGRASVAATQQAGRDLGPKRWLVYPSVLAVLMPLLLIGPLPVIARELYRNGVADTLIEQQGRDMAAVIMVAVSVGLWWVVVGALMCIRPKFAARVLAPFSSACSGTQGPPRWLLTSGVLTLTAVAGLSIL